MVLLSIIITIMLINSKVYGMFTMSIKSKYKKINIYNVYKIYIVDNFYVYCAIMVILLHNVHNLIMFIMSTMYILNAFNVFTVYIVYILSILSYMYNMTYIYNKSNMSYIRVVSTDLLLTGIAYIIVFWQNKIDRKKIKLKNGREP